MLPTWTHTPFPICFYSAPVKWSTFSIVETIFLIFTGEEICGLCVSVIYRASLALDVFLRRYPELASGGTRDPLMGWKQLFASAVVYMAWLARVSVLPPPDGAVKRCLV